MGINLVIAVTDGDWFEMLRQQPNLDEVNFWAPSAANFRALQPGEMFCSCIAPGSLDTSLSHAAGLSDIAVCHA